MTMQHISILIDNYPVLFTLFVAILLSVIGVLFVFLIFRKKMHVKESEVLRLQSILHHKNQLLETQYSQNKQLTNDKKAMELQLLNAVRKESALSEQAVLAREYKEQLNKLREQKESTHHENIRLQTLLHEQDKRINEQQSFIKQSEELLKQQFHRLADKVFNEKSEKFTQQNQLNIKGLLSPLHKQMEDFQKLVHENQVNRHSQHQLLSHQIKELAVLNQTLSDEANNLTRALKSESKTQGNWGELILKRILESSGLQEGREFELEKNYRDDSGNSYRPDVVIHLPREKDMLIDAKVSLLSYENYINIQDKEERQKHLMDHIASMRKHIDQLAGKNYQSLHGVNALSYVLMFVPVEAAYLEAMNEQPSLFEYAFKKNILILSTSNLLVTLKTIAALWQNEDQNKNAIEIARQAGLMHDKFVNLINDLDEIKQRLNQADKAWHAAENKLKSGNGNLIGKAQALKKLGARANKTLSDDWQG